MKVFGVTGWKNSGKTGLVERLVTELTARGYAVSTVKHAHHSFDVDQPGRDSYRHRAAGAQEVVLSSSDRWAVMHELRGAAEPKLDDLLAKMAPVDIVIVEGFKAEPIDKIECFRAEARNPLIYPNDARILGIASDTPMPDADRPVLDLTDTASITDFVIERSGLTR
jgi:molybdopterin-guanine dinucleotide biosynthesis protein B